MTPHTDFHTRHTAKIGNQYIYHSLQGLTTNRAWAWTPDRRELANARDRGIPLVLQAKVLPILHINLKTEC